MSELEGGSGQAVSAEPTGTTAPAPQTAGEQSAPATQTTNTGPVQAAEESFFDPKSLDGKPELQSAYKQMQKAFTKKSQEIKAAKSKVEAYDSFIKDPMGTMQQLAKQYGYNLVQGNPQAKPEDNSPQTWDDVYSRAKQEVLKELNPLLGEVKQMKQQNVEAYLDNNHPDWRTYEDEMTSLLSTHPSLASDLDTLYRMAIPSEVLEARAAKAAMEKLRNGSDAGKVSGTSTTSKTTTASELPKGGSFQDYVAYAKARLKSQGIAG